MTKRQYKNRIKKVRVNTKRVFYIRFRPMAQKLFFPICALILLIGILNYERNERGTMEFTNAAVVTDSEKEQESFKDSAVAPINTPTLVSKVSASATPGAIETKIQKAIVTTYNAEVAQTDADPFTMASGKRVYEGAIASNCHKIGTKIQIRDLGEFTVEDRMNSRYTKDCGTENERLDIFKWNRVDNFKKIAEYAIAEAESHKEVSSL